MKTKKASNNNKKSTIIFFAIALTYNLLLGLYLKNFLAISPMLLTFYLLSALPTLFLLINARSKAMRAVIFVISKTLRTKQGLCFDFAHLFAAFCRSQNIPCYAVDGVSYKDSAARHTWNRVYYDGSWWNLDITADVARTKNNEKLYGFHKLKVLTHRISIIG